jgi:hypothetical protein
MNQTLMYLSILQTGLLYASGFATSQYVATRSDSWGFAAVASTIFLLMSNKFETHRRIEALLGPLPEPTKEPAKGKVEGTVGFRLPQIK